MMSSPLLLLIGGRCAGKSTVAVEVSRRIGCLAIDLDEWTMRQFDESSIRSIWERHGESAWRAAELRALGSLPVGDRAIVALGGGTPTILEAQRLIDEWKAAGQARVAYLKCSVEEMQRRLSACPGDRASLTGNGVVAEVGDLMLARAPLYERMSDLTIDVTGQSPAQVVDQLLRCWAPMNRS